MEQIYEETVDRHFYTNDYNNNSDKGNTVHMDSSVIVAEDPVSYIIKKYNIKTK